MKSDLTDTRDMKLTDLDRELLAELREGARTQGYLVDMTGKPRFKVHTRLQLLAAAGYIENIHETTALYEFRREPDEEEG